MDFKALLKSMGLTDAQITQIMDEGIANKYVPKYKFDEKNDEAKKAKDDLVELNKTLTSLKKFEGDAKTLEEKITKLQEDQTVKEAEYQKTLANVKIENAIKFELNGQVADGYLDIVQGLLDKNSISLKDDGTVIGLTEQVTKFKTEKPLLFSTEKTESQGEKKPDGFVFKGTDPKDGDKTTKTDAENFVQGLLDSSTGVTAESTKAAEHYFK